MDCMTKNFVTCTLGDQLIDLLPKFINTQVNMLPVVDENNRLIGIITKNKVFSLLATRPSFDITIEEFYISNPKFLRPTNTIEETRSVLLKHKIGHAPVVNDEMKPIGVISTQELLHSYNLVYNQLTSIIDFAYDAIILVNNKAEVTMVNKNFTDLFYISSKDIMNKSTTEVLPELDIENVIKNGVTINNTPQIINGQQCIISIIPISENGVTNSAICKLAFRGLKHLQEAVTKVKKLEKQVSAYKDEIYSRKGTKYTLYDIAGESDAIQKIKNEANLAAKSMSTVLITGESGTGKELFAQGIHAASSQMGPFIEVNCAAIPHELLESEFFGYSGGAFTGAKTGGMKGKFELAQNGTIFLDEIGDMSLPLQSKILRVLQEKEFQPLGSSKTIHLNTKIIAATNQNLEKLISEGKFREDLYYRINIMSLKIPPLRERIEDLPEIINEIINRLNQEGFYIRGVTHSALTKLMRYSWPGNVRELQNTLERAANISKGDYIDEEDIASLPGNLEGKSIPSHHNSFTYKERINFKEKEMIISALKETNGNKTKASKLLGISRPWFYKKMKQYKLDL
ncbi:sigma-54-dependent Fis family transcriptional regulator [Sporosarcina sp. Marseille-Q4063]|uniref:sigma-54-dependent Fis family transcriptional regulator n=1 Tax=Sporosarcina sp. Marseille-Q4063 TaxID=2810514 RepID=UPI0020162344|nr:sigma-54-dependent Fis family transcriptional regulator [Sporosarcina sp. Marseille-Q4063]